ncbi:hypothetical protein BP6252_01229 [Coleophoma cylindrospora]|uniref:Carrier domain-containing protein n=1 Tax=Coleophoma cylindrospora TaxID=1849047 RepID=A0A3D8SSB9_9HELO|nr:hypothetical protein BP6252_01229 [Coleophoma cylindrospora]
MPPKNLFQLLQQAIADGPECGLIIYGTIGEAQPTIKLTYKQLLDAAEKRAQYLISKSHTKSGSVILLHLDNHLDNIIWFWTIVVAGCIPCVSTPFLKDAEHRHKHIHHLQRLLRNPLIVTSTNLISEFSSTRNADIFIIENVFNDVPSMTSGPSSNLSHAMAAVDLSQDHDSAVGVLSDKVLTNQSLDCSAHSNDVSNVAHHTARNIGSTGSTSYGPKHTGSHSPVYTGFDSALLDTETPSSPRTAPEKSPDDLAVLMLTSGSTGDVKAVTLQHGQLLKALASKSAYHETNSSDIFLNWVGLDHVANLTEIHLHSMSLAAEQIHLPKDIVCQPLAFLDAIEKHKVSYAFAPNFFLAAIVRALVEGHPGIHNENQTTGDARDLSSLKNLISGGESNVIETCITLTNLLHKYGAPASFIRPGFGMTETCGGCVYSKDCPRYDQHGNMEFASIGSCIPGISARVFRENETFASVNEIGTLRVRGQFVFQGYYNDEKATRELFTLDGWFNTGDLARRDDALMLHIVGRKKEALIINGVTYHPEMIEAAIEGAEINGAAPSYTVVFSHRPKGSPTELPCIIYLPTYDIDDNKTRVNTYLEVSKVCVACCGVQPYVILPLEPAFLVKSSLGKLSRTKIRKAFESGLYNKHKEKDEIVLREYRAAVYEAPSSQTELAIVAILHDLLECGTTDIGVNSNLFDFGVSSVFVLTFRQKLQSRIHVDVPIAKFFNHPIVRDLARTIDEIPKTIHDYDPVVTLQTQGTKTPIFFVHPGIGEVLLFVNLARYITDRPVYALRARGFNGEPYFYKIEEMIESYMTAIKRVQPQGPYSICGHSFGSILTFEIAKGLEAAGDEVKFVGVFDQPPNFKKLEQECNWCDVAYTLAFFLGLTKTWYYYEFMDDVSEGNPQEDISDGVRNEGSSQKVVSDAVRDEAAERKDVLEIIFEVAPAKRLNELGLNEERFRVWVDLAFNLAIIGRDYDPKGMVSNMDVFYADPIAIAQVNDVDTWFNDYIIQWENFTKSIVFHKVEGGHHNLISPPHISSFQKIFKDALRTRGL